MSHGGALAVLLYEVRRLHRRPCISSLIPVALPVIAPVHVCGKLKAHSRALLRLLFELCFV